MKHRVKRKKLNRDAQHRKALYRNLISALIEHGEIKTTLSKAQSIKGLMDKLINRAKVGDVHSRRILGSFLGRRLMVNKLVDEFAAKVEKRTSGYTRIIRLGKRRGDNTMMAKMQFVDFGKFENIKEEIKKNKGKVSKVDKKKGNGDSEDKNKKRGKKDNGDKSVNKKGK